MTSPIVLHHWIGGRAVAGDPMEELRNPSDLSDVTTHLILGSAAEIDAAVGAARTASTAWADAPPQKRSALLAAIGRRIAAHAPALASQLSREEGKLLSDARAEAAKAAQVFEY
jgi:aldehyde dehydrogenase (NAD+)